MCWSANQSGRAGAVIQVRSYTEEGSFSLAPARLLASGSLEGCLIGSAGLNGPFSDACFPRADGHTTDLMHRMRGTRYLNWSDVSWVSDVGLKTSAATRQSPRV
jgi:hypothetical protein